MSGHFSIEWLAQSSQAPERQSLPASSSSCLQTSAGPSAYGTHSESLPGFYCRQRSENQENQGNQGGRVPGLSPHSLPSHTESETGTDLQRGPHTHHNQQAATTGFSSGTEEETSGYESEGGRSLSPSAPLGSASPSPPLGRKPRTAFTTEQISSLERAFKRNAYLGTQDKAELCKKLNLSDKQIRNWFQNRRMKLKRAVQDALAHACQAKVASHMLHYSELQACRPGPYPSYHPQPIPEGPTTAPYLHPHSLHYNSPAASQGLPGLSNLPLDSLYQYTGLPGLVVPPGNAPLMGGYQPYSQQY